MVSKGLVDFEDKTYWLDIIDFKNIIIEILDNGSWRPVLESEADLFDLLKGGKVIGDKKE